LEESKGREGDKKTISLHLQLSHELEQERGAVHLRARVIKAVIAVRGRKVGVGAKFVVVVEAEKERGLGCSPYNSDWAKLWGCELLHNTHRRTICRTTEP
jgi:hypothetical protein